MIIVDTGIWIDHLKASDGHFAAIGEKLEALIHPYVMGELRLGSLSNRARFLQLMAGLRQLPVARRAHVMQLIEAEQLFSTGIGYVDTHLLASSRVLAGSRVWTRSKRLQGLSHQPYNRPC